MPNLVILTKSLHILNTVFEKLFMVGFDVEKICNTYKTQLLWINEWKID